MELREFQTLLGTSFGLVGLVWTLGESTRLLRSLWDPMGFLESPEDSWELLRTLGDSWELLWTLGKSTGLLRTPLNPMGFLRSPEVSLGLLRTREDRQELLGTPVYSWEFFALLKNP